MILAVLSDDDAVEKFRREKFDLGVTELIEPCGLAYFHKIGLQKYVTTDSLTLNEYITKPLGIESNPSFVPGTTSETLLLITHPESSKSFRYKFFCLLEI